MPVSTKPSIAIGRAAVASRYALAAAMALPVALAWQSAPADELPTNPPSTQTSPAATPPREAPVVSPAAPPPAAPAPSQAPASPQAGKAETPPAAVPTDSAGIPAVVIDGQQAESILGKRVRSNSGEDMGRIVDVIVDKAGQIRAAIIDFGGFLGVGTRQIAVDWRAIRFPADQKSDSLTVDLTRDQLRVAPVYKAGEQIVVLGRPRAEPTAGSPQASASPPPPPPPVAKDAPAAPAAKDPSSQP